MLASLIPWLLKPSNIIIVILSAFLALTWIVSDTRKHKILKMEAEAVKCEAEVTGLRAEMGAANSIIESLKANLAAIKKQAQEWQRIASEANDLRRRIIELQNSPRECEVLQDEYRKVAIGIVAYFNGGLRGKIDRTGSERDRTTTEVLPGPVSPGASGTGNDAPTAR